MVNISNNMKLIICGLLFMVVACLIHKAESNSSGNGNSTVKYNFELFEIVPYVIKTSPIHNMKVEYPDGSLVELGNNLTETQVSEKPKDVSYHANHDAFYTLVFVQSNDWANKKCAKGAQVLLWLVYNIKGDKISTGEELLPYQAPSVQNFRYVYLVLQQKKYIKDPTRGNVEASISRDCFNTKIFMKYFARPKAVAGAFFVLVAA